MIAVSEQAAWLKARWLDLEGGGGGRASEGGLKVRVVWTDKEWAASTEAGQPEVARSNREAIGYMQRVK